MSSDWGSRFWCSQLALQYGFVRSLLFMPQTVSLVVVGLVWQVLLVDKIGLFNQFGAALNLESISWLGDPRFALFTVIGISVWFLMGFYMLIFLGGLQDIPREYYEAARIDGAGPVQSFLKITLPLLQPTSFFVLLVSTVAAVCGSQTFDLIYIMTKGGPQTRPRLRFSTSTSRRSCSTSTVMPPPWRPSSSSC